MSVAAAEMLDSKRSVLGRVFDILECFADEPEQTISSLCAKTELPPATVHRMLASLAEWGAIERASRGHYRLGMRLWRLGWGVPKARVLKDIARPHLVDLHVLTGEIVTVCSMDSGRIIVADVIAGRAAMREWESPRSLTLHDSAPGLVFLAHMAGEVKNANSTDQASFAQRQMLAEIRRNGFAITKPTKRGDSTWVAAPIFEATGVVRSTIAVPVAGTRMNITSLGRAVATAARAVSAELPRALLAVQ